MRSWDSSVVIPTGYGLDGGGVGVRVPLGLSSPRRPDRFCGPLSLLSNGYGRALFPVVKQPGREADHLPAASAEIKKPDLFIHFPIRLHGAVFNSLSTGTTLPYSL
jgi:hypothetical protein